MHLYYINLSAKGLYSLIAYFLMVMAMVVVVYHNYNGCSQKVFKVLVFNGVLYDEIDASISPNEDVQKALDYLFREISNTLRKILL